MKYRAAFLLSAIALSGCVPVRMPVTPMVSGCVQDVESGEPVKSARISLREERKLLAIAGNDGCFSINKTKEWTVIPLGGYHMNPVTVFLVDAADYESSTFGVQFGEATVSRRIVKLRARASR